MITEELQSPTLGLGGGGKVKSGSALKNSGQLRAGSITSQRTSQVHRLTVSLNFSERRVTIRESKYSEVCATSLSGMRAHAVPCATNCVTTGIK